MIPLNCAADVCATAMPEAVNAFLKSLPLAHGAWSRLAKLSAVYADLLTANRQHNLTRIVSSDEFWSKHVADSLAVGVAFPELLSGALRVADVGCGAGFPTIPLVAANRTLRLTALETNLRKATFVAGELAKFHFTNGDVLNRQAREVGRLPEYAGAFDVVLARAVKHPPDLVRDCRQLLAPQPNSRLVIYTTPAGVTEYLALATREAAKYGLKVTTSPPILLPLDAGARQFFLFARADDVLPSASTGEAVRRHESQM